MSETPRRGRDGRNRTPNESTAGGRSEPANRGGGTDEGAIDAARDARRDAARDAEPAAGPHPAPATDDSLALDRRDFVSTLATTALGAGLGAGAASPAAAAPDALPSDRHWHRGHQDVIFLGIHFEDNAPPGPIEDYEAAMFDPDSPLGVDDYTMPEYFEVVSDGRFSIGPGPEGFAGWYQASQPSDDFHLGDAVREALDAAIADGFDVTAYDQENPTQIVALTFLGGGGGGVAWVGNRIEREGVLIDGFCQAPARASAAEQDVNYASHEYLHLLGLTDLYQAPGTGNMGVMGAGPLVNVIPWSKVNVGVDRTPEPTGWDETTPIHPTDQPGILPPQSVENQFYTVVGEPNPAADDPDFHEHYYLAYNDGTGVDAATDPGQHGLVVWHHYQSMGVEWGANNLQFATPPSDGSAFRASDALPDASLVGRDVALEDVRTEYDSLLFNDPEHRTTSPVSFSYYAVDVDASRPEWLPDLSHREDQPSGDVIYTDDVVDARVSWRDDEDLVTLRLYDPTGEEHAVSDGSDANFAVVRSEPLSGDPELAGGWKLEEETAAWTDGVEYYRAANYPTHELASRATVAAASLEAGELAVEVSLAFGDDSPYDYGEFGPPSPDQFDVSVDGASVDPTAATELDPSTYEVTAQVGAVGEGEHEVGVAFVDEKAGVTHRTFSDTATVTGSGGESCGGVAEATPAEVDGRTVCDLDGDGLHRDVTGDGDLGQDDVVSFFENQHRDAWQRPIFDYSENGSVGHGDVVALFEDVAL